MMRLLSFVRVSAAVCVAVVGCAVARPALADTYTIYNVSVSGGSIDNVGLTDDGSLTTVHASNLQYYTFTPPDTTTVSSKLPPLTFDNGSKCSVSASGFSQVSGGVCNNGREVFQGTTANQVYPDLYLEDASGLLQMLFHGPVNNLLIDAMGDIAFVSTATFNNPDTNFLYYDETSRMAATPEPSSLVLLGTGLLGAVAVARRRVRGRVVSE